MERERRDFETLIKTYGDFAGEPVKQWYVLDAWYEVAENTRPAALAFNNHGCR